MIGSFSDRAELSPIPLSLIQNIQIEFDKVKCWWSAQPSQAVIIFNTFTLKLNEAHITHPMLASCSVGRDSKGISKLEGKIS